MSAQTSPATDALVALEQHLGPTVRKNELMARHCSLRVGGPADLFLVARSADQLANAVSTAETCGVSWRITGGASNLLVADAGVDGLVVKAAHNTVHIASTPADPEVIAAVDAGCVVATLARRLARQGLRGLEWAANLPGTIGAAVVNNSGAFGSSLSDHLRAATLFTPSKGIVRLTAADLGMSYRTSVLKRGELAGVVIEVELVLTRGDSTALQARIEEIEQIRKATQPAGHSVGSVFANPPGDAAGRLIEEVGLKGYRIGDAEVSTLHANFILNRARASAADVLALLRNIQATVFERHGIWLQPELELLGRFAVSDRSALIQPTGDPR